ncbi:hypothetical protein GGF32_001822, partial [Allomyces javanicus]
MVRSDIESLREIVQVVASLPTIIGCCFVVNGSECYRANQAFDKYLLYKWLQVLKNLAKAGALTTAVLTHCEDAMSNRLPWQTFGDDVTRPSQIIYLENIFFGLEELDLPLSADLQAYAGRKWDDAKIVLTGFLQQLNQVKPKSGMSCNMVHLLDDPTVKAFFTPVPDGPYEHLSEYNAARVVDVFASKAFFAVAPKPIPGFANLSLQDALITFQTYHMDTALEAKNTTVPIGKLDALSRKDSTPWMRSMPHSQFTVQATSNQPFRLGFAARMLTVAAIET